MADMTVQEFCARHGACRAGHEWAMENCQSMREVWDTARPDWLLWVASRPGVLDERDLRLLLVRRARSVEHLLTDQRSRHAIAVGERFALGNADAEELAAARVAAWAAAATAEAVAATAADAAAEAVSAAAALTPKAATEAVLDWAAATIAAATAAAVSAAAAWAAKAAAAAEAVADAAWTAVREQQYLRLFLLRCDRSVERLLNDRQSRHVVVVAERLVLGSASALAATAAAWTAEAVSDWALEEAAAAKWLRELTPCFDREEVPDAAAAGE